MRKKLIRSIIGEPSIYKAVRIREDMLEMAKRQARKTNTSVTNYIAHLIYDDVNK